MSGDNTLEKHRGLVQPWSRGQSGNPAGRPKGARNKLGEDFLEALAADFEAHGPAVIKRVREEYPHHYLKVVAALMTKQIDLKPDHRTLDQMTDRELLEIIAAGSSEPLPPDLRDELLRGELEEMAWKESQARGNGARGRV